MNSQGANDVSPEAMQSRIQQARREAETLKDRIKRKKDELCDTSRMCSIDQHGRHHVHHDHHDPRPSRHPIHP